MRHDFYVENDSGAYSILSESVLSRVIDDGREHDQQFVDDHEVILQALVGDDSFVVRVVVGEPLTSQEQEEWISRVCCPLKVPCGKLLVAGGFDPDTLADMQEEGIDFVEVPPGDYLVEVLTYLYTMNGRVLHEQWGPDAKLGTWFRREYPDRAFPSWVAAELAGFADEDPGHEAEWSDLKESVATGKLKIETDPLNWVGVVVHLLPANTAVEISEPSPEGFFAEDTGLRRPARFPLGLPTEVADSQTRSQLHSILPDEDLE